MVRAAVDEPANSKLAAEQAKKAVCWDARRPLRLQDRGRGI